MSKGGHVGRVLVIGFWGFPGNWHRTGYQPVVLVDKELPEKYTSWIYDDRVYWAHSSTLALVKAFLEEGFSNVKVAIYGLDTLACPSRVSQPRDDNILLKLNEIFSKYVDEFIRSDPREYKDVFERARSVLELYASGYAEELGITRNVIEVIDVVPGVGTFQLASSNKQYRYIGSPVNTHATLILKILDLLKKTRPDLIILDISHGVNYLPVLGREAVLTSVEVYSSLDKDKEKIVLAIVNSDPILVKDQLSRIHLVELHNFSYTPLKTITRLSSNLTVPGRLIEMLERTSPPQEIIRKREKAAKILSKYKDVVNLLKNIFNYGLVLYLVHILTSKLSRDNIIKDLEDLQALTTDILFNREVAAEQNDNKTVINIKHSYIVRPELVYLVLMLELLSTVVDEINNMIKDTVDNMLSLKKLKELSERLSVSEVGKLLLERDCKEIHDAVYKVTSYLGKHGISINNIEVVLDNLFKLKRILEESSETSLEKIHKIEKCLKQDYSKCPMDINEARSDFMKRNFYAHSGLERKVTKILITGKKEEEIYVGYIESCKDIIEELTKLE